MKGSAHEGLKAWFYEICLAYMGMMLDCQGGAILTHWSTLALSAFEAPPSLKGASPAIKMKRITPRLQQST